MSIILQNVHVKHDLDHCRTGGAPSEAQMESFTLFGETSVLTIMTQQTPPQFWTMINSCFLIVNMSLFVPSRP